MTDSLSLGPVLDLIERWQHHPNGMSAVKIALLELDIPALRALAEQHAAQLRASIGHSHATENPVRAGVTDVLAAADFLCASRREPEAE